MFIAMFEAMDNEYMKERAADIRDVTKRVLAHLLGVTISNPSMVTEEVVVIAEDLTPSDTAQLNRKYVKGFTTDIGGRTSHSAIMARSMEIPAVVGTKEATATIQNGDIVIIDGLDGEVIVNPTEEIIAQYEQNVPRLLRKSRMGEARSRTNDDERRSPCRACGKHRHAKRCRRCACEWGRRHRAISYRIFIHGTQRVADRRRTV